MKNLFIYTFGCKINQYESQIIREKYCLNDYVYVDNFEQADVIIINSCSVTAHADKQCEQIIKKFHTKNEQAKIILTGCFAKVAKEKILQKFPFIEILMKEEILKGSEQRIKTFDNHSRAFIKIQDGCNSFCSYCIVPYARNIMWSKPADKIIEEINNLTDIGYSEIVLTGIHIGKYDKGISYLLSHIYKNINKFFRIRLSSIEVNEITDELIDIIKNEKERFCHHLHIPIQSASDTVLKDMNRKYLSKDFLDKMNLLKQNFNDISITTDVICGFPTETDKDFDITYNFLKDNEFARLHVFPFSPRQGTKAYSLKQVYKNGQSKIRTDKLLNLSKELEQNYFKKFVGTTRKAVSLRGNKALTDNYLTIENIEKHNGIFEVEIR
ncbi:MAG: MiaB/RimO family radical SAM methylthiotransferase [Elusimicrobia bacterium]|nr:MiaB/RimO family radical SAM methylthiotransferase [Elusimicrobiota bacterium]